MNYEALMKKQLLHMPAYRLPPQISDMMKQYGIDHIEKMAANENVFGVSDHVKEVVAEEMQNICRYPGDRNQELFEQIGKKYGIPSDCVQINVGATGVLNGIADTFLGVGDEIVMSSIPYMQYPMMALRNGAKSVMVPVKEGLHQDLTGMLDAITEKTKIVIVCNPGNPTGVAEKSADMEAFIRKVPENVLVVIDEAYLDFAATPGCTESMMKLIPEKDNLIVTKTFSKIYAMAGMRLGFAAACPELLAALGRGGTVPGACRLAIVAAIAALEDEEHTKKSYEFNSAGRAYLMSELRRIGCEVYDSDTNFVYFKTGYSVSELYDLLMQNGIMIRNFDLNRVSVGRPKDNEKFISIVEAFMKEKAEKKVS
ncbi:pyridoxal phosphate-dependent aminotransferase [Fusicatenibacter saccharivorans]|uniref:pyridoxal phosphate-dependent aminotransferase n=1 Tax=Fusicatenibacter saccharivorans TaxID=1150298 RepID=UPI0032C03046